MVQDGIAAAPATAVTDANCRETTASLTIKKSPYVKNPLQSASASRPVCSHCIH